MSDYKVIATRGRGVYLLVEKDGFDPETGNARVLDNGVLHQPFRFQSIIARGYCEEYSMPDEELDKLLEVAYEVPEGPVGATPH